MITNIYSILDVVAKVADAPIIMANDDTLRCACRDMLAEGKEKYCRHPEDYSLARIGQFDTKTGRVINMECVQLGTMDEFCASSQTADVPTVRG